MVKQFIKFSKLCIVIFYLQINVAFSQENIQIYANENYWSSFVFNYNENRFCYSFAKDEVVGSPVYCRGNFIKRGDTLLLKSDFDNKRLPIKI
jgi:hypothetical protein